MFKFELTEKNNVNIYSQQLTVHIVIINSSVVFSGKMINSENLFNLAHIRQRTIHM